MIKTFQQVKGKAANLKINVNNDTAGRYLCKATVEGYPEIEAQANVFIKGKNNILQDINVEIEYFIKRTKYLNKKKMIFK